MKKIIVCCLSLLIFAVGCGKDVANTEYIKYLRENGNAEEEIQRLIEYERDNKYLPKDGYVDVTRRTVKEVAQDMGITLDEYLAEYDLPADLPPLVSETEANYTVPVSKMAQVYGMDYEELKSLYNFPDTIEESTPWGYAIGEARVVDVVGDDDAVNKLKERYHLPDYVNGNTLWKEVREIVDAQKQKNRETEFHIIYE